MKEKTKFNYKILVPVALILLVAFTTAITFSFWQWTLETNQTQREQEVVVGDAGETQTAVTVNLLSQSNIGAVDGQQIALNLVPIGMIGNPAFEIDYVILTFTVRWIPSLTQMHEFADPTLLNGAQGILRVQCTAITSGDYDFWRNEFGNRILGDDGDELFLVDFWNETSWAEEPDFTITGHSNPTLAPITEVRVRIRMTMTTPEQYARIAGQEIFITLNFAVEWQP